MSFVWGGGGPSLFRLSPFVAHSACVRVRDESKCTETTALAGHAPRARLAPQAYFLEDALEWTGFTFQNGAVAKPAKGTAAPNPQTYHHLIREDLECHEREMWGKAMATIPQILPDLCKNLRQSYKVQQVHSAPRQGFVLVKKNLVLA